MPSITGTIKSIRKDRLKAMDEFLTMASEYTGQLTREEEDHIAMRIMERYRLAEEIDSPIVTVSEIMLAKRMMKKQKPSKRSTKRF